MAKACPQRITISVGETRNVYVNFTDELQSGDSISSVSSVTEQTTSDLTLANEAVTTSTYVEDGTSDTVAIGKAVVFNVLGGTAANSPYTIRVTVVSDSSPAETFVKDCILLWE